MNTLEYIDNLVTDHKLVFLSLSKSDCKICKTLKPEIETILSDFDQLKTLYIDLEKIPDAAGKYSVTKLPTILLYAMGKEVYRIDKSHDKDEIRGQLEKYYKIFFS